MADPARITQTATEVLVTDDVRSSVITQTVIEVLVADSSGVPLYSGSTSVGKTYSGTTEISRIYDGATLTHQA